MYQYLTGKLAEKNPTWAVVDVNGIGYQLQIPLSTFHALPEPGQTVRLLTHFVVREDVQALYGFLTEEERHLFRLMISVSGIGPKMAITILSGITLGDLKQAIIKGSLPVLTAIPGIGRKTAERLIVELREKIVLQERPSASANRNLDASDRLIEDSLQALVSLGYQKRTAKEAIQKVLRHAGTEELSVEEMIRASLKYV